MKTPCACNCHATLGGRDLKFATELKILRERSGLSFQKLGALALRDGPYIYRLEAGEKLHPSHLTVERLAMALLAGSNGLNLLDTIPLYISAGFWPPFLGPGDLHLDG